MHLIVLCIGVLSCAYLGDCVITDWTTPVIATAIGSGTLTYPESQAVGALATLATNTAANAFAITSQPTTGKLAVVTATGALTLETGFFFDYETEPTYVIVVTGGDGTTVGTATITISITDVAADANYGSFTAFYRVEDAAAAATTIATISASGGTSTAYTIKSGDTNTDFAYGAATGVLTTAKVMARSTTAAYTIVFQAVAASMTSTATVYVCVGTTAQCGTCSSGSGVAGLQISLVLLLVAIVTSRIK